MPFTESFNFNIADVDPLKGRTFLLKELDGWKIVLVCDIEYLKRFTVDRDF